jgi:F-type H+-transporting ATPase subunit gamma
MKMVSAAKYSQAERQLRPARTYGVAAQAVLDKAEVVEEGRSGNHLFVVISSDRGLCGSVHSNLARTIRPIMEERASTENTYFVCVGDKIRTILQRTLRDNLFLTFTEVGKRPPVFVEATAIAHTILNSGLEFDTAEIIYNRFKNVISYQTTLQPFVPLKTLSESENLLAYDDVDADVLQCYHEMTLANMLYHAMKEGACSEQSSRMTAMDSASKNAGEMIDRLTLTFNRTRQAVITRELIEIISGAAAV